MKLPRMLSGASEGRVARAGGLLVGALLGLVACAPVARPDGGNGLLPVGAVASDLTGKGLDGARVSLASTRGHASVVYFYPKDETPGCTKEACTFRDAFAKYSARGVAIFAVSRDSEASHDAFRKSHSLPFFLVPDEDGQVARAYGVPSHLGMASRVTFLVGPDGKVVRQWPDVDPGVHADQVLAAIDQAVPATGQASP